MEAESAPVMMSTIARMVAHGMEPLLSPALAVWLNESGMAHTWPELPMEDLRKADLDLCIGLGVTAPCWTPWRGWAARRSRYWGSTWGGWGS